METRESTDGWICQCRKCHGVHNATDAVQWVFEWSFGDCDVPVVVSVNVHVSDRRVFFGPVHWNDEDDFDNIMRDLEVAVYLVSCRPGRGTAPTEGDVERWTRWQQLGTAPDDWLLADGLRFRSVPAVVEALLQGSRIPAEATIGGDWDPPSAQTFARRARYRREWTAIKERNARSERERRRA